MTNEEVYTHGRIVETFNYLNQFDLEGIYIGYLIKVDNITYQVIVNQHNMIQNPDEPAVIFNIDGVASNNRMVNTMNALSGFPERQTTDNGYESENVDPMQLIQKYMEENSDNQIVNDNPLNNINPDYLKSNSPW